MNKCSYCNIETDGYFDIGNHDRSMRIWCCEDCYNTCIQPLSREHKQTLIDLVTIILYRDVPCNLAG